MAVVKSTREVLIMMKRVFVMGFIFHMVVLSAGASHFDHIKVFKALYRWPPPETWEEEAQWWAEHYDLCIVEEKDIQILKHFNPEMRVTPGVRDLSVEIDASRGIAEQADLEDFCGRSGYDYESCYLHYFDDTQALGGGDVVSIPGYGGGSAGTLSEARVRTHIWGEWRYMYNPGYEGFQQYEAGRLHDIATAIRDENPEWGSAQGSGVFVDERDSEPDFPSISGGGTILEYMRHQSEATDDYNTGAVSLIRCETERLASERIVYPNIGNYTDEWADSLVIAASGALAEACLSPARAREPTWWDQAKTYTENERFFVASTAHNLVDQWISGYTGSPNYLTGNDRHRMFCLANYYMGKTDSVYFGLKGAWDRPLDEQWFLAIEHDVGQPTSDYYTHSTGVDPNGWNYTVFARDYTKAKILFRPKGRWDYHTYDASTSITSTLDGEYHVLQPDGSVGGGISTVSLKNSEGVILIPDALVGVEETDVPDHGTEPRVEMLLRSTVFKRLPADSKIGIYSEAGRLVAELTPQGGQAVWHGGGSDGKRVGSGVYFYVIESGSGEQRGKLVFLK
jgi:hypothetical protein